MTRIWSIGETVPVDSPDYVKISYAAVIPYLLNFLTAPHPYRKGVMCPFMPKALAANNVYFSYFESQKSDKDLEVLIRSCVDFYKGRGNYIFGAMIILFEEDFDILRVLRVHIQVKEYCIENELMVGALYKDSQAPSLHSEDYFPLRTPVPTLVLRDLTAQDLQFLTPGHYGVFPKLKFLNSFISKFSASASKGASKNKVREAVLLRRKYRCAIGTYGVFAAMTFGLIFAFLWGVS